MVPKEMNPDDLVITKKSGAKNEITAYDTAFPTEVKQKKAAVDTAKYELTQYWLIVDQDD